LNRTPLIGEGVRVPWGFDTVPGEVVDLRDDHHAVVDVPIEGASGEALDTIRATFNVDTLEELPRWQVTGTRGGRPTPGADATAAWYVDAQRDGDETRVEVRLSDTAAAMRTSLPAEARRAIQTRGRSAVEKFAHRFRLPRVVVVGSHGVFELRQ
jgi:hypothetical protein